MFSIKIICWESLKQKARGYSQKGRLKIKIVGTRMKINAIMILIICS